MALDWYSSDTNNFVDQENKMMLRKNRSWDLGGDYGKGDAIGRNFISYFCYLDERFLEGVENCWERIERNKIWKILGKEYYYQGYRYPTRDNYLEGISRDHTIYTILLFKYAGYSSDQLKEFIKHLRFKLSKKAYFTIDMWIWSRALIGSKFFEWLFYSIEIPLMKLARWWNKKIYRLAPFEEESHQDDWVMVWEELKPKRIKKLANLLYPIYALHILSWQIYVLPESKRKKKLQKICLDICPKHNYVIKMLLGDRESFSKEDVLNYKPMTSFRWSGILNPWINNRDMQIINDKVNIIDVDYVKILYNTITCKKIN